MGKTDGRKKNGGAREGAGRKPKAEELKLIETIDKALKESGKTMHDIWKKVIEETNKGSKPHLDTLMNYYYGKPKERKDINLEGSVIYVVDDTE